MGDSADLATGNSSIGKGDGAGILESGRSDDVVLAPGAPQSAPNAGSSGGAKIQPQPGFNPTEGEGPTSPFTYNLELFRVGIRLELPATEQVQEFAKFSMGEINCFAISLKKSDALLLLSDHHWSTGLNEAGSHTWCIKRVPWFQDPSKKITALSFDDEGTLYIGTLDGNVAELKALRVLSDQRDSDINTLYRLVHKINQILVWNQDNHKILLCVGSHGNLAIISGSSTPVNVTFTCSIVRVELFQNKLGLTCALVCLESGQNVFTVLDDLDLPSQQNESQQKKSIFRKAKDNIMSRLSEDKLPFFSSKKIKSDTQATSASNTANQGNQNVSSGNAPNVTIKVSGGGNSSSQQNTGGTNAPPASSQTVATGSGSASVKFQSLEEFHCRGELRKVKGRSQFARHSNNKLDIFDDDFRQVSSVFVSTNISDVYVINRLFYCVDRGVKNLRVSLVHNNSLKEIAVIPFRPRILSIETIGESLDTPCSVFIFAEDGIYELTLKQDPVQTCVVMLLRETNAGILEAICNALNVSKSEVCAIAGDMKADEGKFSKSILYYKLAGLTYAQISAKFGSKGLMPAMLFFFELVDQEKTKLYGGFQDKQVMSDLALLGRIEQYLRYGTVRSKELPRNPGTLVQKMLLQNIWYSSRRAAEWLADPDLLWGLKLLSQTRLCFPDILHGLRQLDQEKLVECLRKNLIWKLITQDWLAVYSAHPVTFLWFREIVQNYVKLVSMKVLIRLLNVLLPWRRELQRKIFTEISESAEVINYANPTDVPKIMLDDYVELFVIVLLEVLRRKEAVHPFPSFVFKSDARQIQRMQIQNHKNNMVATLMLSFTFQKTLSASMSHVLCVRNGRVYSWGENKFGRLGVGRNNGGPNDETEKEKFQYHTPTLINLSPTLKLHVESVCAGTNHSVALTSVGTLLVWGQNNFGQLGLGPKTLWTARPVPLHAPDVIFTCVAAGSYHTVAVDHLNRVWTWGWGVYGQLGNGRVENSYFPHLVDLKEKIVAVSAGHSHTTFLTCFGRVLTTGCNHFGQLGLGSSAQKVKTPEMITGLPVGTLIRLVECGTSSTVMVSTKNRLFYSGLNPASLKSLLNSSRRKEKGKQGGLDEDKIDEERDFSEPTMIDTSHMAGDIAKVNCASTHFAVMSSLGYVYTWGVGKSGQLVRPDDDSKSLELIYSADDKMIIASDICCAGDCTFIVEKESGSLHGCGFNSCGQLGKMESEEDQAVMMIRTKKRVVKVRQPSNIYFKLREIPGLPKQRAWETENSVMSTHKIAPPGEGVNQELLEWVIKAFRRNYDAPKMIQNCVKAENFKAASILETMAENYEQALQHNLAGAGSSTVGCGEAINKYLNSIDHTRNPSVEQACRYLTIVIHHWSKFSLPGCDLEETLQTQRQVANWGPCLCSAMKEVISLADDGSVWIADNLTPVFILQCINESNKWNADENEGDLHSLGSAVNATLPGGTNEENGSSTSVQVSSSNGGVGGNSSSSASASTLNVLNGNVSFGSLCQSSASK